MDQPERIDLAAWPRREHFEHYRSRVPCSYAITVDLDVTELRAASRRTGTKTYAAQVWALATVVNRHEEFRMTLVDEAPAIWPLLHPAYTVFNPDRETFACVSTPYDTDFGAFQARMGEDVAEHRHATRMFPQEDLPANYFDVSSLPWTSFSSFALSIKDSWDHLTPIFTLGRYEERGQETYLPLAVQIHHAAADGFHTARFVEDLRALLADPTWLT